MSKSVAFGYAKHLCRVFCLIFENENHKMFEIIIYLPFAASLIFGVLLALDYANNMRSQNIHAGIMFLMSLLLFILATLMRGGVNPHAYYVLDIIYSYVGLAVFPLIGLYYKSLTDNSVFRLRHYLIFLPTLLVGTSNVLVYMMMGRESSINYLNAYLTDSPDLNAFHQQAIFRIHKFFSYTLFSYVLAFEIMASFVYGIYKGLKYRKILLDNYSDADERYRFLGNIYIILSIDGLVYIIFAVAGMRFWRSHHVLTVLELLTVTSLFLLWYFYSSKNTFRIDLKDAGNEDRNDNHFERNELLYNRMRKLMEESKLFLDADLTSSKVASELGTNRTYVSEMVNEVCGCSFSEYICRLRVDYSKEYMINNKLASNYEVAVASGFSTTTAFYNAFRKVTGTTPKKWVQSLWK